MKEGRRSVSEIEKLHWDTQIDSFMPAQIHAFVHRSIFYNGGYQTPLPSGAAAMLGKIYRFWINSSTVRPISLQICRSKIGEISLPE